MSEHLPCRCRRPGTSLRNTTVSPGGPVTSMLSTAHASAYDVLPDEHPARSSADPGRSSVDKALELLEILVDHPRGEATLSELAAQVGLPKSTVHRLVTELCQHGLAGRVGVKYCPGLKLAELSVRT